MRGVLSCDLRGASNGLEIPGHESRRWRGRDAASAHRQEISAKHHAIDGRVDRVDPPYGGNKGAVAVIAGAAAAVALLLLLVGVSCFFYGRSKEKNSPSPPPTTRKKKKRSSILNYYFITHHENVMSLLEMFPLLFLFHSRKFGFN